MYKGGKMKKLGVCIILILIVFTFSFNIFATSIEDLTQRQNELQQERAETNDELEEVKITISKTMSDLQELSEKIIKQEAREQEIGFRHRRNRKQYRKYK